jgi:hypothetical protein
VAASGFSERWVTYSIGEGRGRNGAYDILNLLLRHSA